jgi:hypothetical protein
MSNGCAHYFFAIITFAIITASQSIKPGLVRLSAPARKPQAAAPGAAPAAAPK